jgi:hypothetical protein
MYFTAPSIGVTEMIGVAGFFLYVTNYSLLTLRIWSSDELRYFVVNLTAASCVLIGLTHSFNLAAALIQIFFVSMSIIGIALRLRRSPPTKSRMV